MPATAANVLLVVAVAVLADSTASMPRDFDREKSLIEAHLQKWRGHVAYFNRKKGSWVCETNVTSGDRKTDKLACAAYATCHNRHHAEFNALLNMSGNIEAQHAAARRFYKKKWDCFRLESAPLINELALRRAASATR